MDSSSLASILAIIILVFLSAFFSASETAFSSINKIRIKHMADNGSKRAQLAHRLTLNYDKLLSTILVGNNLVNIATTSIMTVLFVRLFASNGATLATFVTTVIVLIFGEITPKSLAKDKPEAFAMFAAPFLNALTFILTPVNFLFTQWKMLLSKLIKSDESKAITEQELLTLVEEAEQEGAIEEADKDLINSVIEFNDSKAVEILTPRVDIYAVPVNAQNDSITKMFLESGYSRIPVYKTSIDNIQGIIHLRDYFDYVINGDKVLEDIISPVVYITPATKISDLLNLLQRQKCHMAVVTDEYGGTMGIVTMEDILEELVGEIWDEHDEIIEEFTKIDDDTYMVLCSADLDEMLELFGKEDPFEVSSVSGWIIEQLGKSPEVGDSFEYEDLYVSVTKVDRHRVLECLVTKTANTTIIA